MSLRIYSSSLKIFGLIALAVFLGLLGLSTGYVSPVYSAQVDETWGGGEGGWTTGLWDPRIDASPHYPHNGVGDNTYNVFINSGGSVILDVSPTIDNLTIASGGSLKISDGKSLALESGDGKGVVTNNGSIFLYSEGHDTALYGYNTKLTGTGRLILSNDSHNIILYGQNYAHLTNDTGHTIMGSGSIGSIGHDTLFTNLGTVAANQSTPLTLLARINNTGTIEANGGTLHLQAATVTNTGGTIRGIGESTVELSSVLSWLTTITGGTLAGSIQNTSGAVTLTNLANQGAYTIMNGAVTKIDGTITNTGTIKLDSSGSETRLVMNNATLTGTGKLIMSNDANNKVLYGDNYAQLTNGTGHTIMGSGSIGSVGHDTLFTNFGTVTANQGTPLTLLARINNTGTLEANGGTLRINDATVTNTGGTIQGVGESTVDIAGGWPTSITGGTLAGSIRNTSGGVTLANLANQGVYTVMNGAVTKIDGTITNTGTIKLDSSGSETRLVMNNAILTGTGKLVMSDNVNNIVLHGDNWAQLTNDTGHTIMGSGSIGSGGHGTTFINLGTVTANQSTPLNLYANVTNNGTFQAASGGSLVVDAQLTNLSGGTLTGGSYLVAGTMKLPGYINNNAGKIVLDGAGSQLLNTNGADALANFAANAAAGDFTVKNGRNLTTAGAFSNAGNMTVGTGSNLTVGAGGTAAYTQTGGSTTVNGLLTAGSIAIDGGTLSGSGVIDASVISSVVVAPGTSPGMLTINGDYTQTTAGSLLIELGGYTQGLEYDFLDITGYANLGGTLEIALYNGFAPGNGSSFFDILTADQIVGTFDTFTADYPDWIWGINYVDTNNDSFLDTVRVSAAATTSGQVPEPATVLLLSMGLLGLIGMRRKDAQ